MCAGARRSRRGAAQDVVVLGSQIFDILKVAPAPRACPPTCAPAGRVSVGRGRRQAPLSDYEENVKLLIAALQDVNATVALRTCRRAACCAAARGVRGSENRALEWLQHYIRSRMHFGSGTLTPLTRADTLERVGAVAHGRRAARRDA